MPSSRGSPDPAIELRCLTSPALTDSSVPLEGRGWRRAVGALRAEGNQGSCAPELRKQGQRTQVSSGFPSRPAGASCAAPAPT